MICCGDGEVSNSCYYVASWCTECSVQGHPDDAPFGTLYRSAFWLALIERASVQFELMKMKTVYLFPLPPPPKKRA